MRYLLILILFLQGCAIPLKITNKLSVEEKQQKEEERLLIKEKKIRLLLKQKQETKRRLMYKNKTRSIKPLYEQIAKKVGLKGKGYHLYKAIISTYGINQASELSYVALNLKRLYENCPNKNLYFEYVCDNFEIEGYNQWVVKRYFEKARSLYTILLQTQPISHFEPEESQENP